jgi:hypothetical protein
MRGLFRLIGKRSTKEERSHGRKNLSFELPRGIHGGKLHSSFEHYHKRASAAGLAGCMRVIINATSVSRVLRQEMREHGVPAFAVSAPDFRLRQGEASTLLRRSKVS